MAPTIDSLHRGFRGAYLDYAALTAQVHAWAESFPDVCRVESLGETPEGRQLWLLTIGRDPDRVRPTAWVDGNMHASELAGSSVALTVAEDLLRLHVEDAALYDLPAAVLQRLRELRCFVLPRMSPDGAEAVLTTGRYVRSVPRDERPDRSPARWVSGDVDGDGLALVMRVVDPTGEFVEAPDFPGLMVARELGDEGPFYKIYPEGTIDHWDGHTVPTPSFVGDNPIDLNRNFPWSWAPAHEQVGAGAFPLSEPESRAVVQFTSRHPEIFAWLNLHTFGGVFIRPLGHGPDSKMNQEDLEIFKQVGAWAEALTGYPMVSGHDEFLYEPDKPLHGDLTDYAYHQRGALAYVVELWDLFHKLGLPRPKKFVEYYQRLRRGDLVRLAWWDREDNEGRIMRPWTRFEHPQLGEVEIGGIDPRIGLSNPPLDILGMVCGEHAHCFLHVAAMAPQLAIGKVERVPLGDGLTRVDVVVENRGYLGSYVLPSAKGLDWNEPVHADATPEAGGRVELVDRHSGHVVLGHLDGWGRGLEGANNLLHLRSRGTTSSARARWIVRGAGRLVVRVGSCRVGWLEHVVDV
ncbi:MAG: peptidase M14 [Kofleriaceae bacterium]|nr:peptidase M14 [Myxococcales bacterium]MCB9561094.1 peptidase M14 [Kofleriaceae bacterium]MCB9571293.1 peptidase M14 [Kofleriaceae bacterium]